MQGGEFYLVTQSFSNKPYKWYPKAGEPSSTEHSIESTCTSWEAVGLHWLTIKAFLFRRSKLCQKSYWHCVLVDNVLSAYKNVYIFKMSAHCIWETQTAHVKGLCLKIARILWSCFFTKLSCHGNIQNIKGLLQLPHVWAKKWAKFRRNS